MERRINQKRWMRDGSAGATSYEEWALAPIPRTPSMSLMDARSHLSGIPAPDGHLWMKSSEKHPPNGEGWYEV